MTLSGSGWVLLSGPAVDGELRSLSSNGRHEAGLRRLGLGVSLESAIGKRGNDVREVGLRRLADAVAVDAR